MNRWVRLAISYAFLAVIVLHMIRVSAGLGLSVQQRLSLFAVLSLLSGIAALTATPSKLFEEFIGSSQRVRQVEGWALLIVAAGLASLVVFRGLHP